MVTHGRRRPRPLPAAAWLGMISAIAWLLSAQSGASQIAARDHGDLDLPFPDASHELSSSLFLGAAMPDADSPAHRSPSADGDDFDVDSPDDGDDEDGVDATELDGMQRGRTARVSLTVTNLTGASQALAGYFDFNGDSDFGDSGEAVTMSVASGLVAADVELAIPVPIGALDGAVLAARFRLGTGASSANGVGGPGEVEDHFFSLAPVQYDFGDLPAPYATTHASGGAFHRIIAGWSLGALVDEDTDGLPSASGDGDDNDGDDEEAIGDLTFVVGAALDVVVPFTSSGDAGLWLFVDWDKDGSFAAAETYQAAGSSGGGAVTFFGVTAPSAASGAVPYRLRMSSVSVLGPNGYAPDGEVEDGFFEVLQRDWGDLPAPFPTSAAEGGPSHIPTPSLSLGALPDGDPDGQPSQKANGDDAAGSDDEDGVAFLRTPAQVAIAIEFTNSTGGAAYVGVFFDADGDGSFVASEGSLSTLAASGSLELSLDAGGLSCGRPPPRSESGSPPTKGQPGCPRARPWMAKSRTTLCSAMAWTSATCRRRTEPPGSTTARVGWSPLASPSGRKLTPS